MKVGPRPHPAPVIDGYAAPAADRVVSSRAPPQDSPSFQQVLERLASEVDRGQSVVNRALKAGAGGDQAGVYRYVEAVDLCTRLVDRAAGAVRTTLQSQ